MADQIELAPDEWVLFVPTALSIEQEKVFIGALKSTWRRVPQTARQAIFAFYSNCCRVIVRPGGEDPRRPIAKTTPGSHLVFADSLVIFNMAGGPVWIELAIAEELAHSFLFATHHLSHDSLEPEQPQERIEWDKARENAAQETMKGWGQFDMIEHAKLGLWVQNRRQS